MRGVPRKGAIVRNTWNRVATQFCRLFHNQVSQPVKGHYLCRTCRRPYPVPWHEGEEYLRRADAARPRTRSSPRLKPFQFQKNHG
jgi:hypothetical protein